MSQRSKPPPYGKVFGASPLFELTVVFVLLDHVTRMIVNANHSIM